MNDITNEIVDTIEVRYIPLFSTPLGVPVIADKISPFPETKIIGKISIDTKNAIFKKNPCIPKQTPSILCPVSSLILLPISLSIAGGKINPAPAIGIPIKANNTNPNFAGIAFPRKNKVAVNIISIIKQLSITFLYPYFLERRLVG